MIKEFVKKLSRVGQNLAHYGRLGKVASKRSFLVRERRRFLLKIGEKAVQLVRDQKLDSGELTRLVEHLEKYEALIQEIDYGGENGVTFAKPSGPAPRRKGRTRRKKPKKSPHP